MWGHEGARFFLLIRSGIVSSQRSWCDLSFEHFVSQHFAEDSWPDYDSTRAPHPAPIGIKSDSECEKQQEADLCRC